MGETTIEIRGYKFELTLNNTKKVITACTFTFKGKRGGMSEVEVIRGREIQRQMFAGKYDHLIWKQSQNEN